LGSSGAASEDLCDRHAAVEREDDIVADSKETEELGVPSIVALAELSTETSEGEMARAPAKARTGKGAGNYPAGGPGRQLKARLKAGDILVGGILVEFTRPSLVLQYREAGFDFLYLENEHMLFSPPAFADTVVAARGCGLPVIAKVPQLERAETTRLLDCGVVGIQLPRTETREQVETLRGLIKFPPNGTRATAPGLGSSDFRQPASWKRWLKDQDAETLLVVHIETKAGYENAEAIISTPGVDMVYVGPGDFTVEMGHPGEPEHPAVAGPMNEILVLCQKHKVPFGTTPFSSKAAGQWVRKGARFFETKDELALIYEGASRLVNEYQGFIAKCAGRRGR
jgi:4-hydroxy-2-oxoheptanedioate aldolase